jgi:ribosomal protein S21
MKSDKENDFQPLTESKGGDTSNNIRPTIDGLTFTPLEVRVEDNFERAFKVFRSLVQKERILSVYKEKQSYEKPSDKQRRKKNEAMQRQLENDMKNKKIASGEYEKEKIKKQLDKEKKKAERESRVKDYYEE